MSDQLLLPPASGEGFDFDKYASELKATPKEVYEEAVNAPPEPEPTPPPPPPEPEPQAASAEEANTASFIVEMYDTAVSKLSEAIVNQPKQYPAKHFAMEPMLKDQAELQLSKGLAEGGMLKKIPWWVALLIVVLFHGAVTWWSIRTAKRSIREEEEAAEARAKQQRGQPLDPTSITDRNGRPVTRPASPAPAQSPAPIAQPVSQPGDAVAGTSPPKLVKNYGPCQVCGNPVHHPGRKYCGKSCSGKATSKAFKQAHANPL